MPMTVPIFLGLNLLLNFTFLVYQIIKKVRIWIKERESKLIMKEE